MREHDSKKLNREYERLVEGLRDASTARDSDIALVNPVLPSEILEGENLLLKYPKPNWNEDFMNMTETTFLRLFLQTLKQKYL